MKNKELKLKITNEHARTLIEIGQSLRGQVSWFKNKKENIKKLKKMAGNRKK